MEKLVRFYEYIGNVHVHSVYSDGTYTPAQIAQTAKDKSVDFVILNDHNYMLDKLHLEDEGFYGGVALLVGLEIGGRYHHYLAFDVKKLIEERDTEPQLIIELVNEQGGFGFLAHPFEKGMPFHEHSVAYTWNDLTVQGYSGICIWNFSSCWKERIRSPLHGIFFVLFKSQLLKGPSKRTLSFWDQVAIKRKVVAIGGSDAHGTVFRSGFIQFTPLPYEFTLSSINIHILLGQPLSKNLVQAKSQIYEAMKYGRLYIAHDNICPARGFNLSFISQKGDFFSMGDEVDFTPGRIEIILPAPAEVRLIRNGELLCHWRNRRRIYHPVNNPGVYRVEVFKHIPIFGWRPWIFSNPIFLR